MPQSPRDVYNGTSEEWQRQSPLCVSDDTAFEDRWRGRRGVACPRRHRWFRPAPPWAGRWAQFVSRW